MAIANQRAVFLMGFMGCGKSYWGQRLATAMNYKFVDLDELIEERQGQSISEIFQQKGEQAFRNYEQAALSHLSQTILNHRKCHQKIVVALGGGTPCFFDNINLINHSGTSIYLKTPVRTLAQRLQQARDERPLIAKLSLTELQHYIEQSLSKRSTYYEQAHHIFNMDQIGEHFIAHYKESLGSK